MPENGDSGPIGPEVQITSHAAPFFTAMWPASDMAALLDLTPRALSLLAAKGIIPKARGGIYPAAATVRAYLVYLRERANVGDTSFTAQRTRLTRSRADIAEMEHSRLLGELLPANEVLAARTAVYSAIKQRLLSIPSKCAPRLLMLRTANEAKRVLEPEIHEALEDIANATIETIAPPADTHQADVQRDGGGERGEGAQDDGPAADADDLAVE